MTTYASGPCVQRELYTLFLCFSLLVFFPFRLPFSLSRVLERVFGLERNGRRERGLKTLMATVLQYILSTYLGIA